MNITVCVKQVPDTWSERTLRPADRTVDRDAADAVINELDEFAIEEGLQLTEQLGGEVTILSMGPDRAAESCEGVDATDYVSVRRHLIDYHILDREDGGKYWLIGDWKVPATQ